MRFLASVGSLSMLVKNFSGTEEMSLGYDFKCHLYAKQEARNCVGERISLKLDSGEFNGVIASWSLLYSDLEGNYHYSCSFASSFEYYLQWPKCKIYENQNFYDLLTSILNRNKIRNKIVSNSNQYYEYLCQYHESESRFVRRLALNNGVNYFFEHKNQEDTIVFCNNQYGSDPDAKFTFTKVEQSIDIKTHDFVNEWSVEYKTRPRSAKVFSFDINNPESSQPMEFSSDQAYGDILDYQTQANKTNLTKGFQEVYKTRTRNSKLRVGGTMQLVGHEEYAGQYRAIKIKHAYNGDLYSNELTAMKVDQDYIAQPEELNRAYGIEIATVVGAKDMQVEQKNGRIRVRFCWDEVGECKTYIPILQPVAGNGFGFYAMPRIGQRVSVMFENGDPSRPFVCGAFYDGSHLPPYEKEYHSGYKTKSIGRKGNNELLFSDQNEQEYIKLSSSKDLIEDAAGSKYSKIEQDVEISVAQGDYLIHLNSDKNVQHSISIKHGSSMLTIKNGDYIVDLSQGQIDIKVAKGDIKYKIVDGEMSIDVPKISITSQEVVIKSEQILVEGNDIKLDSTGPMSISGTEISIEGSSEIKLRSGKINLN